MLVLSRQRDEVIIIGETIEITVVDIRGDKVRLGISAPKHLSVHRSEVYKALKRAGTLLTAPSDPVDVELAQWKRFASYCRCCALVGDAAVEDFKAFSQRTQLASSPP